MDSWGPLAQRAGWCRRTGDQQQRQEELARRRCDGYWANQVLGEQSATWPNGQENVEKYGLSPGWISPWSRQSWFCLVGVTGSCGQTCGVAWGETLMEGRGHRGCLSAPSPRLTDMCWSTTLFTAAADSANRLSSREVLFFLILEQSWAQQLR